MSHARPDVSPEGEFRVPDDDPAVQHSATDSALPSTPGRHESPSSARARAAGRRWMPSAPRVMPTPRSAAPASDRAPWTSRIRFRPAAADPADLAAVDLGRTPREVVAATAFGVVAVPLLFVYAGLFIVRYFLEPGVQPDITSTWGGEGLAGLVAAVLAIALAIIVGRAVAGRGLIPFVAAELVVAAACGWLLSDSSSGGEAVSAVVAGASVIAVVCALLPGSRRWFAAHRAADAADNAAGVDYDAVRADETEGRAVRS